ncbi:MAG TPA: hypothetical protein PLB62_09820 [Candidatus Sumerlaeota bacterium]|nr:hypothetical protein [Candidatus Sumerlaeota bacterium]
MKSRIIGILIVLFWLGMMLSLFRDSLPFGLCGRPARDLSPQALADNWQDQTEWMRIFHNGVPVGAMKSEVLRVSESEESYMLSVRILFDIRIAFIPIARNISLTAASRLDPLFTLEDFDVHFKMARTHFNIQGHAIPEGIRYRVLQGASSAAGEIPMDTPPSLLDAVQGVMGSRLTLRKGAAWRIPVYDPIWNRSGGEARVAVIGKESIVLNHVTLDAWRIETTLNSMVSVTWVDDDGRVLMRSPMSGILMQRAEPADIMSQYPIFKEPLPRYQVAPITDYEIAQSVDTLLGPGLQNMLQNITAPAAEEAAP